MIILIDNYDSFVHNLARYVECLGFATQVIRNDAACVQDIVNAAPSHVLISPGPCSPNEAGICLELVRTMASTTPILGVCLGHQVIAQAFGGVITRTCTPSHGKMRLCTHTAEGVFSGIDNPMPVGLYHSLCVDGASLPACLAIIARSEDNTIMAIAHRYFPCVGVQFHPESILTPQGDRLLANFLREPIEPVAFQVNFQVSVDDCA